MNEQQSQIIKHGHFTKDRINFTMKRTINVAQYEGFDIYLGYASDKEKDESPEEAIDRVEKIVIKEFDELMDLLEKGKIKAANKRS